MDKKQVLKQYFGYDSFREGQETLIDSILSGRDVLGIMPTGAGKSMCYQIPALLMEGITLVVSPLISLMKDQVGSLNQVGIHAAYLNSSLTASQYYKALDYARAGRYPIIYVAPERLETEEFLDFAMHTRIAMVAVDEAHCVSQWGQDFRPSYLKIVDFIGRLPRRPVVAAFTATATSQVREDIVDILMLQNPAVLTTGFDRPNLYFGVMAPKDRYAAIRNYLETHPGDGGIIYCLTRKTVEEVCSRLNADGFAATRYHAGLSDAERRKNQDDFIYDRVPVIVCSNAFGMGIDKSNVRFVLHYGMPKNLESYYQEAGRAGRDGEPSECILYYSGQDVVTNQFFIDNNQDNRELDAVTRAVVQERDRERLRKMTFYCFTNECLRDYILRYFGEYGSNYCGNCSNCLSQFEMVDVTEAARAILGCVESCRQRYGVNVILDTVRGANTAKIRSYRMDQNPHYGELAGMPAYRLRQVMNQLQVAEYLTVTGDEYSIVKLTGKSRAVLQDGEAVTMKMAKEAGHPAKVSEGKAGRGKKAKSGAAAVLPEADMPLFEKLRALRTEIAREESVPPYVVFSDKTLVSMCAVKPRAKAGMLTVTGVGQFKYDKYGERFLDCIRAAVPDAGEAEPVPYEAMDDGLYYTSDSADFDEWNLEDALVDIIDVRPDTADRDTAGRDTADRDTAGKDTVQPGKAKSGKAKKAKAEFAMTRELAEQVHYSERTSLSDFIGQINDLRDEESMKRLTIKSVEEWLGGMDLFETWFSGGMPRKRLTDKGEVFGIQAEERISEKGNAYFVFYYTEQAQRAIVGWLLGE